MDTVLALHASQPCAALRASAPKVSNTKLGREFMHIMRCEQEGASSGACAMGANASKHGIHSMLGSWLMNLCAAAVHETPYLHLRQSGVIREDFAQFLQSELPKNASRYQPVMYPGACPDHKCHGKTLKGQMKDGVGLVSMLNHDHHPEPHLAAFRDAVHSSVFKRILWERLRLKELHPYINAEQTYVATTLFRDSWGYDISPHPDAGFKLASFFFPMPTRGSKDIYAGLGTQICSLKPNPATEIYPGAGWQDWDNFNCVDSGFSLGNFMAFRVTSDRVPMRNRSMHAVRFWSGPKTRLMFRGHVCNPFNPKYTAGKSGETAESYDISRRGLLTNYRQQMKAFAALPWQRSDILRRLSD